MSKLFGMAAVAGLVVASFAFTANAQNKEQCTRICETNKTDCTGKKGQDCESVHKACISKCG